nr:hypothetical protein [uncultured Pseudoxanthomonas sp.]
MTTRIPGWTVRYAGFCVGMLVAGTCLATDPDKEQARLIAEQFVAGKQSAGGNPQEGHEAGDVVVADLDNDGEAEIVVLWTLYGPTYSHHGVAVLAKQGSRYAPAGETQDALGLVEGMKVAGGVIELKTKWPAANDPRCCPSIAKTLRYRWSGGALIPVK